MSIHLNSFVFLLLPLFILVSEPVFAFNMKGNNEWDWQTSTNWDYKIYDNYMVRNNIWGETAWTGEGVGDQTIFANSESDWKIVATHTNGTGNAAGQVKAYPQVVRGWVQGGIGLNYPDGKRSPFVTSDHGLNQRIDDLEKLELYHNLELPRQGRYMVLYDTYFFETERPQLPYGENKPDMAVMIFTNFWDDTGWLYGSTDQRITIGDREWRYRRSTGSSIVRPGGVVYLLSPYVEGRPPFNPEDFINEELLLDFKEILHYLRDNKELDGNLRVSSIQLGVEIIDGGEYRINDYWTDVQGEVVSDEDFEGDVRKIWDFETPDQIDDWDVEYSSEVADPVMELSTENPRGGDYSLKITGNYVSGERIELRHGGLVPDDVTTLIYHVWIPQVMVDSALAVYDVNPERAGILQNWLMFAGWQWRSEVFDMHALKGDDWNRLEFVIPEEVEDNSTIQAIGVEINMRDVNAGETSVYIDDIILDATPPVSVDDKYGTLAGIPDDYKLFDNFPNPFNPSTQIQFALPEAADVFLEVYDILGRRVATLINNKHYSAGHHMVTWDARNQMSRTVTSGVYIFRLKAGDFVETKRMMFLR